MALSNKMQNYIEAVSKKARERACEGKKIDIKCQNLTGKDVQKIIDYFDINLVIDTGDTRLEDNGEKRPTIFVNQLEREKNLDKYIIFEQKKEEIFHELGHAFFNSFIKERLSESENAESAPSYDNGLFDVYELTANYFAKAFLMPVKDFTDTVLSHTYNNICETYEVSSIYGVSNSAVVNRGRDLMMWD